MSQTSSAKNEEAPVDVMLKEAEKLKNKIKAEDEQAPLDIVVEAKMDKNYNIKYKALTKDHTVDIQKIKEIEQRAMSMMLSGEGVRNQKREP